MTEQERIKLRRLATDLEPFIEALARSSDYGSPRVAGAAWAAEVALRHLVAQIWLEVRSRK